MKKIFLSWLLILLAAVLVGNLRAELWWNFVPNISAKDTLCQNGLIYQIHYYTTTDTLNYQPLKIKSSFNKVKELVGQYPKELTARQAKKALKQKELEVFKPINSFFLKNLLIWQKGTLKKYYVRNPSRWTVFRSDSRQISWLLTTAWWVCILLNLLLVWLILKSRLYFYATKQFMAGKHHIPLMLVYFILLIWLFWRGVNLLSHNLMLDNLLVYLFTLSVFGGWWLNSSSPSKIIKHANKNLKFLYLFLFLLPGIIYDLTQPQKVLIYYDKTAFKQLMIVLFLLPAAALATGLNFKKHTEQNYSAEK